MGVNIRIDVEDIRKFAGKLKKRSKRAFSKLLDDVGRLLAETMREKTPKKTGFLAQSITVHKTADSVEVYPTASYAPFVEYGAKPHIITPVHAKALRFEVGGETVFARLVHHPGFPGRFFVRGTFKECLPKIRDLALQHAGGLIKC